MAVKFLTFNSTGLGPGKPEFIRDALTSLNIDIALFQETWLLPGTLKRLSDISDHYSSYGISSVDNNDILSGRPYGGLGILWHKSLAHKVKICPLRDSKSKRLCAVEFNMDNELLLVLNAYLPNDNFQKHNVSDDFLSVCDEIEVILNQHCNHNVIVGGDLNIDFDRKNAHDVYFLDLVERYDLQLVWDKFPAKKMYTYSNTCSNTYSCLDQYCVSKNILDLTNDVLVCESPLNPSGHRPVMMELLTDSERIPVDSRKKQNNGILWHKVTKEMVAIYQDKMNRLLLSSPRFNVEMCRDVTCNVASHKQEIDSLCSHLIDVCLHSDHVFPRKSRQSNKVQIPGWNEQVKPFRQEYLWWYHLWKDMGKPCDGLVQQNMQEGRRQYFYAIRRCKRKEKENRMQKMAESLARNKTRDFYQEVKKLHGKSISHCINGETDKNKIAQIFGDKYMDLFNCVQSDPESISLVQDYIATFESNIHTEGIIDETLVLKAIKRLKSEKADGSKGLISNHIIYASDLFVRMLSKLATAVFIHGHQPADILLSTISSIPKDARGDLCADNNYRGITLTSCIAKIFDLILLLRNENILYTSGLQFAYKQKHSTVMCTLVLKEIVSYYMNSRSAVAACFLDSSKAFDRVRHDKLFLVLIERGMSPIDLRVLYDLYQRQLTRSEWAGSYSEYFKCTNGIRQGSVISPVLYCLYMDQLINRLQGVGIGCWIGLNFYGCLSYADDMTLLCPTVTGLQKMIKTCEIYGAEYDVIYNATKSKCMMFSRGGKENGTQVLLQNCELAWTDTMKYLGCFLTKDLSEGKEIQMKCGELAGRTNTLLSNFGGASVAVLSKLFTTQCSHLYGVETWSLKDPSVRNFVVMWNRCVRRLLNLPKTTHTRYLSELLHAPYVLEQIFSRFVGMVRCMLGNQNDTVNYLARYALSSKHSIISRNLQHIASELKMDIKTVLSCRSFCGRLFHLTREDWVNVSGIRDLTLHQTELNANETKTLLTYFSSM